jgi:hypothetical protein
VGIAIFPDTAWGRPFGVGFGQIGRGENTSRDIFLVGWRIRTEHPVPAEMNKAGGGAVVDSTPQALGFLHDAVWILNFSPVEQQQAVVMVVV